MQSPGVQDVKPGEVRSGKIERVEPFGLVVELSQHLHAICPLMHMSDSASADLTATSKKVWNTNRSVGDYYVIDDFCFG